jgi:hypothetical protein
LSDNQAQNTVSPRPNGGWARSRDKGFYLLWFEFLKISPSYELARRLRAGSWSPADEARKPADFDRVLDVYDDLGDIRALNFQDWWQQTAVNFFGYRSLKPSVARLGTLRHNANEQAQQQFRNMQKYLDDLWNRQGEPTSVVLSVPLGLTKAQVTRQVLQWIAKYPEADRLTNTMLPKYRLDGQKLDSKSLFRYVMCVWVRAQFPKMPLWRVGVYANLSSTYSNRLRAVVKQETNDQPDDCAALKVLTSRAVSRAILIAENAARGCFPSYRKLDHATSVDWSDMRIAVKHRMNVDEATYGKRMKPRSTGLIVEQGN